MTTFRDQKIITAITDECLKHANSVCEEELVLQATFSSPAGKKHIALNVFFKSATNLMLILRPTTPEELRVPEMRSDSGSTQHLPLPLLKLGSAQRSSLNIPLTTIEEIFEGKS